jgi:hypothetical protein
MVMMVNEERATQQNQNSNENESTKGNNSEDGGARSSWVVALQRYAIETIKDIGFDASVIDDVDQYLIQHHAHLRVDGMMCQNYCGKTVENKVRSVVDATTTTTSAHPTTTLIEVRAIFGERRAYVVVL